MTARTIHGRHLLQPSPRLNALIVGALARAQKLFDVHIYACVFLSNHFHMLASASSSAELSKFKCFIMSNIAQEAGRLHEWKEKFWGRRCRTIPITDEEALVARLRYILEHGVKEGLVRHPADWPGVHSVDALTKGEPSEGIWVDRTAMFRAKKRVGQKVEEEDFTSTLTLTLDVLPIWEDLDEEERMVRASTLVEEAAQSFPGKKSGQRRRLRVRPRSPHYRPQRLKRGFAPLCHASTREHRSAFREAYRAFVDAYRNAAERLKRLLPELGFPPHALVLSMAVPETG